MEVILTEREIQFTIVSLSLHRETIEKENSERIKGGKGTPIDQVSKIIKENITVALKTSLYLKTLIEINKEDN